MGQMRIRADIHDRRSQAGAALAARLHIGVIQRTAQIDHLTPRVGQIVPHLRPLPRPLSVQMGDTGVVHGEGNRRSAPLAADLNHRRGILHAQ